MPIHHDDLLKARLDPARISYTDRDVMLYALGVGYGAGSLRYVYENDLQVAPTFATVIGFGQSALTGSGINWLMVMHGEQRLTMHRPLPPAGEVVVNERVAGVVDKGAGKGALILLERTIADAAGAAYCTLGATIFARGDGGFGGAREGAPIPHAVPERAPDLSVACATRPDQALLYALSGDRNPLHRDPNVAKMLGYERPILHGLCTYGIAARAVADAVCDGDAGCIGTFDARFTAPVYPGETIVTQIWRDGALLSFRALVQERETVVLNNGKCTLK